MLSLVWLKTIWQESATQLWTKYYNTSRIKEKLGGLSPIKYRPQRKQFKNDVQLVGGISL